ncbi:hypothetical protein MVES_003030 [Malassezia vespertilionis]|uniref:Uncharacterized protein n=1 Tax=Malassezia vespertilionis TaxID=2020962 RepID=A0A2N1J9V4_9BASI|nr:hypothetical protein MVES_003030 [Malassezia vespertilionis]
MLWTLALSNNVKHTNPSRTIKPVSRAQRMQRIEQDDALQEHPHERLRRLSKRIDTWGEERNGKSIWQSWLAISPRTRIVLGLGAVGGLYLADWLEKKYPSGNNKRSTQEPSLRPQIPHEDSASRTPKFFSISVVDHK